MHTEVCARMHMPMDIAVFGQNEQFSSKLGKVPDSKSLQGSEGLQVTVRVQVSHL